MEIRVEYFYDDEANLWGFEVDQLHLVGGGDLTKREARRHALEAIAFVLEGPEIEVQDSAQIVA